MTTATLDRPVRRPEDRLRSFGRLAAWLDYWGSWARRGRSVKDKTPLEILLDFGEERIPSTNPEDFPLDIQKLERGLGQLRIRSKFHWKVIMYHHVGRMSVDVLMHELRMRRKGVIEILWQSYVFLDGHYRQHARDLWLNVAPASD
jgi:hypothetical protein